MSKSVTVVIGQLALGPVVLNPRHTATMLESCPIAPRYHALSPEKFR